MDINKKANSNGTRILIVDDEKIERTTLAGILQARGFDIHMAADGEETVRVAEVFEPELIIMGIDMPRMDGRKACERIRSMKLTSRPTIIMVSSLSDNDVLADALRKGADDFVIKPVNDVVLLAKIDAT